MENAIEEERLYLMLRWFGDDESFEYWTKQLDELFGEPQTHLL